MELHSEKTRLPEFGPHAVHNLRADAARKVGEVQLPELHAHQREEEERTFHRVAAYDSQTVAAKLLQLKTEFRLGGILKSQIRETRTSGSVEDCSVLGIPVRLTTPWLPGSQSPSRFV